MTHVLLQLHFLGQFQLQLEGTPIYVKAPKVRALLTYLVLESDREHSRIKVAELLWSDRPAERSLHNLRETLRVLRKLLGGPEQASRFLHVTRQTIRFLPDSPYWLDVHEFLKRVEMSATASADRIRLLEEAARLYRGDLLENTLLDEGLEWDLWLESHRYHLRQHIAQVLMRLSEYYESIGMYKRALEYVQRLLDMEPWQEEYHRRKMLLLAFDGQRSAALRQYELCVRILREEMDVSPSPETVSLYQRIRQGELYRPLIDLPPMPQPSRAEPATFIGREEELAYIQSFLEQEKYRLLSILGMGGIGKSALAQEVLRLYKGRFADGALFVPLEMVESPELIPQALAQHLGLIGPSQKDLTNSVLNYLAGKEMLLILDNFEHLLEGRDFILQILERAPKVKIIVTSREPVGLYQEWHLYLKGLPYPEEDEVLNPMEFDAIRWFVESARRVYPTFSLNSSNVSDVVRICRYVQGSPLGILLATTWLSSMSVKDIARSIEEDMDVLQAHLPDLPARHRSMRAVIRQSWNLLTPHEQAIFRGLGIFQGTFSQSLAQAIVQADMSTMATLVSKSLIIVEQPGQYTLHPVIRRFAREQLQKNPEEEEYISHRYASHLLSLLVSQLPRLRGKEVHEAIEEIRTFLPEFRAAWRWTAQQGPVEWLQDALYPLYLFYDMWGGWEEALHLMTETLAALAQRPQVLATAEGKRLHARLLVVRAHFLGRLDRMSETVREINRAEPLIELYGLPEDKSFFWYVKGLAFRAFSEEAEASLRRSLAWYKGAYAPFETATTLIALGHVLFTSEGDVLEILPYFEEALAIFRELGHPKGIAQALNDIATSLYQLGHFEEARQAYEESLAIKEKIGDRLGLAVTLNNLGSVALIQRRYREAAHYFERSAQLYQELGSRFGIAYVALNQGNMALLQGDVTGALRHYMRALHIYREMDHSWGITLTLRYLAKYYTVQGRWERARDALLEAIDRVSQLEAVPLSLSVLIVAGLFLLHIGKGLEGLVLLLAVREHPACGAEQQIELDELLASAPIPISRELKEQARRIAQNYTLVELRRHAYQWIMQEGTRP